MLVPLIITYYVGASSPSSIIQQLIKDFKLAVLMLDKKENGLFTVRLPLP